MYVPTSFIPSLIQKNASIGLMNMLVEKDLYPAIAGPPDIQMQMRTVSEESQIAQDYTEENFEFLERSEWSEMREKVKGVRRVQV